jgi:GTPase SAR1 family protein
MCAYADNNKWFSEATSEVKANLEKYFKTNSKYAKLFESFNNLLFTWGNAGAGKTVFLAKMAAKQYQRNNKNGKIKVIGPNIDRATNLTTATGVEDNADRIELFKYLLGADSEAFKKYELMMAYVNENRNKTSITINGKEENPYEYYADKPISIDYNGQSIVMAKSLRILADDFIKPEDIINKPDLAIVDEITKFDTFELQILDRAGIKVIGLGDRS